ncbi:hypothetical protein NW755_010809 [Fusarium falciforme]|uniref:Uncharacterized protein n=1 Tax=Fusarium falciforme TaxID=195108 RepID=A0A9W8UW97_9HYPO|nr:hypothetical protein NW755_010809 [Fusarium falciforme]KAJ4243075.1 hypothetical protein NW757_011606 [Fusarium falciforme]
MESRDISNIENAASFSVSRIHVGPSFHKRFGDEFVASPHRDVKRRLPQAVSRVDVSASFY